MENDKRPLYVFCKPSHQEWGELIPEGAMRVGPGTDAVVFKTWDTTHTECEI